MGYLAGEQSLLSRAHAIFPDVSNFQPHCCCCFLLVLFLWPPFWAEKPSAFPKSLSTLLISSITWTWSLTSRLGATDRQGGSKLRVFVTSSPAPRLPPGCPQVTHRPSLPEQVPWNVTACTMHACAGARIGVKGEPFPSTSS